MSSKTSVTQQNKTSHPGGGGKGFSFWVGDEIFIKKNSKLQPSCGLCDSELNLLVWQIGFVRCLDLKTKSTPWLMTSLRPHIMLKCLEATSNVCWFRRQRTQKRLLPRWVHHKQDAYQSGWTWMLCCSALDLPYWTRSSYCLLTKNKNKQGRGSKTW